MPGVFVSGYASGAGKSTVCMALIARLLDRGMPAASIAYIKPATQCEAITDVVTFCQARGVEAVGIGPVVFRSGFTNEIIGAESFLQEGEALLKSVVDAVCELQAKGKFVVVDGVGYPSVGSCVGLGNALVAAALALPVLLVGPPGLGDCIDTFELMITYFVAKGAKVAAAIVNKSKDTPRHKVADTLPLVAKWFTIRQPGVAFLGSIPAVQPRAGDDQSTEEPYGSDVQAAVASSDLFRFADSLVPAAT